MKTRTAIFAMVLTLALPACKKDKDKKPACRMVSVDFTSPNGNTLYNITYNSEGKVTTIRATGSIATTKVFTYTGNTILISETNNTDSSFESRDSIRLDNWGSRAVNIRNFLTENGDVWLNNSLEYDGDELVEQQQTFSGTNAVFTTRASYLNGNIVSLRTGNVTATLDYFLDQKAQTGDYLEISAFLDFGMSVYPHKNLVKVVDAGNNNVANYHYEFNNDGDITKLTVTLGATVNTYTYQYQCN